MAQKIFKYELEVTGEQEIEIPFHSKILTVQTQNRLSKNIGTFKEEYPCVLAMVNTNAVKTKRKILMFGTGLEISTQKELSYIGSFQIHNGIQIYHVFEEKTS